MSAPMVSVELLKTGTPIAGFSYHLGYKPEVPHTQRVSMRKESG